MELKQYFELLKKHRQLFWSIWLGVISIAFLTAMFWPTSYQAVLSINIARKKSAETDQKYNYDLYYRMEADDLFGKTLAQWATDPNLINKASMELEQSLSAGTKKRIAKSFRGEQLAPNYVLIQFETVNENQANKISTVIKKEFVQMTEEMNKKNATENWFELVFNEPLISPKRLPFVPVILGGIFFGFLLAVLSVTGKHYWQED